MTTKNYVEELKCLRRGDCSATQDYTQYYPIIDANDVYDASWMNYYKFDKNDQQRLLKELVQNYPALANTDAFKNLSKYDWNDIVLNYDNSNLDTYTNLGWYMKNHIDNLRAKSNGSDKINTRALVKLLFENYASDNLVYPGPDLKEVVVKPYDNPMIDYLKSTYPDNYQRFLKFTADSPYYIYNNSTEQYDIDSLDYWDNFGKQGEDFWNLYPTVPRWAQLNFLMDNSGTDVGSLQRLFNLGALLKYVDSPNIYNNKPTDSNIEVWNRRYNKGKPYTTNVPAEQLDASYQNNLLTKNELFLYLDEDTLNKYNNWSYSSAYKLMDELAHAAQFKDTGFIDSLKEIYRDSLVQNAHDGDYESLYDFPGTTEYNGHTIYQPAVVDYYLHNNDTNPDNVESYIHNYIKSHNVKVTE